LNRTPPSVFRDVPSCGAGTYTASLLIENDATNFVMNLSGSGYSLSPTNGPLAGGNLVSITNGYFGTITNVLVSGTGAVLSAISTNGVTLTMPPAGRGRSGDPGHSNVGSRGYPDGECVYV
jgi:hypothetical protein